MRAEKGTRTSFFFVFFCYCSFYTVLIGNIPPPLQTRMSAACTAAAETYETGIFAWQIFEEIFLKYL